MACLTGITKIDDDYLSGWGSEQQSKPIFSHSAPLLYLEVAISPEMQGRNIIASPLPFVFNLDAAQVQNRYWVRLTQPPAPHLVMVQAWPKRQEDRAQYKMVQIALDAETFVPRGLAMYAPNFDAKAPVFDQYEFNDVKRNSIGAAITGWMNNFVPDKPPRNWKIIRDNFIAVGQAPAERR